MRELPSGTVTFLFTDIEGSTELLRQEGDRYADLLAEHRRAVRDAFTARGGVEVDTAGDAFFVAFERAGDAVRAAGDAQEALKPGPIRVRMGLHTGEPLLTEEGYVGIDVHKAARIMAAGHGGQVLLSEATRRLVEAEVKDLGLHRLKDLQAPERIFQLGSDDFPPLKSLNRTNLPIQPTPFLGREAELAQIISLLTRPDVRLLTLTGPGGTGKTRLALQAVAEVADELPGGVTFVPLASLTDPDLLVATIATALGLRDGADASLEEAVIRHLATQPALVLLDNVEQLLPAAATMIARLHASVAGLRLLVTSREPLRVSGENDYPVAPLVHDDAVELFIQRARSISPAFTPTSEQTAIVEAICARLDRLPLALELAAARLRILTLPDLLNRLEHRLPLLTGGARDAPERQRTLAATVAWSYDLLSEQERHLFECLSVFTGGASLDAAGDVCAADLDEIESLVDKSLVRRVEGAAGEARVLMLETIREFGLSRLEAEADGDAIRRAHAEYFLLAAEQAEPLLKRHEQMLWLDRIENDHDNLRAALDWWLTDDPARALRLAAALWLFWYMHGHVSEGRRWLALALQRGGDEPSTARAKALDGAGYLAGEQTDHSARGLLEESLRSARAVGDLSAIAIAASHLSVHMDMDEGEQARALGEEAVSTAEKAGDRYELAVALNNLGQVMLYQFKDATEATELWERSLAVRREIGDVSRIALSLSNLSYMALFSDDAQRARRLAAEALDLARSIGDKRHVCFSLQNLGLAALADGQPDEAETLLHESLSVALDIGHRYTAVELATQLAAVAAAVGDNLRVAQLMSAAGALEDAVGVKLSDIEFVPVMARLLDAARAEADPTAWDVAWKAGASMSFEDVVNYSKQRATTV
jgi:predicted ATPase/class 3 adenylate cyclase/Tfp pilus assembly protein PilF